MGSEDKVKLLLSIITFLNISSGGGSRNWRCYKCLFIFPALFDIFLITINAFLKSLAFSTKFLETLKHASRSFLVFLPHPKLAVCTWAET